jgi:ankyrin repeat protein
MDYTSGEIGSNYIFDLSLQLIDSAENDDVETVVSLLENNANPNFIYYNTTALIQAVKHANVSGNIETVKLLLDAKADPNVTVNNDKNALIQVCKDLNSKDVDSGDKKNKACSNNHDTMRLLLEYGANPNCIFSKIITPLHIVTKSIAKTKDLTGICLLLKHGADPLKVEKFTDPMSELYLMYPNPLIYGILQCNENKSMCRELLDVYSKYVDFDVESDTDYSILIKCYSKHCYS